MNVESSDSVAKKLFAIAKRHEQDLGGMTEESEIMRNGASRIKNLQSAYNHSRDAYNELLFRVSQAEAMADYYQSEYAGKWVPIGEKFRPGDRQRVLVIGRNGGIQICRFDEDGDKGVFVTNKQGIATVKYWMPLPEPPKEEA